MGELVRDLVSQLRAARNLTFAEFAALDPVMRKLGKAQHKARLVVERIPTGSGRRGGQARARWTIKCEAVERRYFDLRKAWEAARCVVWT